MRYLRSANPETWRCAALGTISGSAAFAPAEEANRAGAHWAQHLRKDVDALVPLARQLDSLSGTVAAVTPDSLVIFSGAINRQFGLGQRSLFEDGESTCASIVKSSEHIEERHMDSGKGGGCETPGAR
jgi:hypothetical protein